MINNIREICDSCRAETPVPSVQAAHRYLTSSAGCWARYGGILAREYSDARYMSVHPLTVDAYALQHPGAPSSQTIKSQNIHLVSLYCYFRTAAGLSDLTTVKQRCMKYSDPFEWLEPPASFGALTVNHVWQAPSPEEHKLAVIQWAESVFNAWQAHHSRIAALVKRLT